jgi:thioredoxin-dependent peroxiredoxin
VDTPETNKKFAEELGLDYPILSDPGRDVARAYGALDSEKDIAQRWTFYIGADGKILKIDRDIKNATAGADVARTLASLGLEQRPN